MNNECSLLLANSDVGHPICNYLEVAYIGKSYYNFSPLGTCYRLARLFFFQNQDAKFLFFWPFLSLYFDHLEVL